MMNELMRKIANTVIANLANTSEIGLFNGKMGITIFMYEYAKSISDNTEYEEIADLLIDDIYSQIKPDMSLSLVDGYAGVGWGLSYLLKERLIDGDPNDVLQDIDKRLLENPKDVLSKEMRMESSSFSSGLYFLSRYSFCNDEQKKRWTNLLCDAAISFMLSAVRRYHFEPRLSLLNSMLFTFSKLSKDSSIQDNNIIQVQHDLLLLILSTIKKGHFVNIDILLLKEIKNALPIDLYKEYENYLEPLLSSIDTSALEIEELNNELWWYLVYELNVFPIDSIGDVENYVDQKLLDYSYDIEIINKQFSVLGLFLIKHSIN